MRRISMIAFAVVAGLAAAACASKSGTEGGNTMPADSSAAMACPMCAKGQAGENVWCEHCKAGYVSGEKVSCAGCYAQKTGGPPCPTCTTKKSGW